MSAPFPKPTGQVLQSLAFWNKIQLAYSERRQALGQAAATLFVENAYWQDLSMFQTWQNWLEANCTSFVNHSVNGGDFDGQATIPNYTVATWRAAAGLHADGFSRFDMNGTRLAYGIAQDDDAIVANTLTELQNGFSALKWVNVAGVNYTAEWRTTFFAGTISNANASWYLNEWVAEASQPLYLVFADMYRSFPYSEGRTRAYPQLSGYWTGRPSSKDCYGTPYSDVDEFIDVDGTGILAGKYKLIDTYASGTTDPLTGPWIDESLGITIPWDEAPFVSLGWTDGDPARNMYCGLDTSAWVVKWDFTNINP